MTATIHGLGPCQACGHDPACGGSQINDNWYCHDGDHSCYETQSQVDAGLIRMQLGTWIVQHSDDPTSCECGWRAESPDTHPHVAGCPNGSHPSPGSSEG